MLIKKPLRPAIFLDRDGTLNVPIVRNRKPYPPATIDQFQLLPDAIEGCRKLHAAGYALVVVTNQPDVGRGTQTQAVVEAMHARLLQLIPELSCIEVSYDPGGTHPPSPLRKPAPGMLYKAATELQLDLAQSWMIGDRWSDVGSGLNAGCRTIFIERGYDETLSYTPSYLVHSFAEAVEVILAQGSTIS